MPAIKLPIGHTSEVILRTLETRFTECEFTIQALFAELDPALLADCVSPARRIALTLRHLSARGKVEIVREGRWRGGVSRATVYRLGDGRQDARIARLRARDAREMPAEPDQRIQQTKTAHGTRCIRFGRGWKPCREGMRQNRVERLSGYASGLARVV